MTMLRYNAGKVPLSLVPTSFFEALANSAVEAGRPMPSKLIDQVGQVLDFGAQKYAAHNWRKGDKWSSVLNSALRHLVFRMLQGEFTDPESGLPEAGHLGCNIAFLLEFAHTQGGEDDRHVVYRVPIFATGKDLLTDVLQALLRFRDGGSIDNLRDAAWALACWVEQQDQKPEPEPEPEPEPSIPTSFPFRFPQILFIDVEQFFDPSATRH